MARAGSAISCTTVSTQTMVRAIRSVFDGAFSEEQFQNLRVTPQFPMSKHQYPAVLVDVDINEVTNAGVGHREFFADPSGDVREWGHRMFKGSISLGVMALSPLDRDVLTDKLIEMISFGRITAELRPFYYYIWGDPNSIPTQLQARYQLELNTDVLQMGAGSVGPVPWESEDELLYSKTITVEILGGFYNAVTEPVTDYIQRIDFYSLLYGEIDPNEVNWVSDLIYADSDTIEGFGEVSSP